MEEELKDMYISLGKASIEKDIYTLDKLLSDNYILVHMTGTEQSKKDYINSVINEELKYYDIINESIEVTVNDNKAHIIGKSKTLASPFEMTKSWWKLKQDMTLEKINGKWQITKSIASTY